MEDQSKLSREGSGARRKKSRGINGKGVRDYAKIRTSASLVRAFGTSDIARDQSRDNATFPINGRRVAAGRA